MEKEINTESGYLITVTESELRVSCNAQSFSSEVLLFAVENGTLQSSLSSTFKFSLALTNSEASLLCKAIEQAKQAREPELVEEYEWLHLQPKLIAVFKDINEKTPVHVIDERIEEFKSLLGERDDKGMLKSILRLRNVIVESELMDRRSKQFEENFVKFQQKVGVKANFDA